MDARGAALFVLTAVLGGETLERGFGRAERHLAALDERDRAFAHLLVLTAVRRLGQIDDLIARCVEKPHRLPTREHHVLRLGAAQLMFLGVAAHAAVHAAVAATRGSPLKGLVNAVLRRIDREGGAMVAQQDAARLNAPDWLWQQWCAAFGEAQARVIAGVHLGEPPLDLSVKRDAAMWAERLDAAVLPTGSLRLRRAGAPGGLPGFAEGAWWVQDAAAALPARVLLHEMREGARLADLCAAPGGKTAQLAAAGARITAVDRDAARLQRVADNLARLHLDAELVVADAVTWQPPAPFDAVLLDAPCTATGTIRRHPDVALHKSAASAEELVPVQARLLQAALTMLAPGGVLVYAVCSLDAREGEQQVARLLAQEPALARVPMSASEVGGDGALLTAQGDLRTLPSHWAARGGMDGFYAARLHKSA